MMMTMLVASVCLAQDDLASIREEMTRLREENARLAEKVTRLEAHAAEDGGGTTTRATSAPRPRRPALRARRAPARPSDSSGAARA